MIKTWIGVFCLALALLAGSFIPSHAQSGAIAIGLSDVLESQHLKEKRKINIYLPEGYNSHDTLKYPVIYILDGGVEEDFIHLVGLARFNSQSWVGRLPKAIVVGIENVNRRRDFTFAVDNTDFIVKEGFKKESFPQYGGSARYMDFLEKELQPYISRKYKVNDEKTIIGESLAGLLATEILLKRPQMFSHYIIISPSLWWGEELLLKNAESLLQQHVNKEVHVYIGAPGKEEDVKMYQEVETLYHKVKAGKKIRSTFDYLPQETHATVIHQAVSNAFKVLYK